MNIRVWIPLEITITGDTTALIEEVRRLRNLPDCAPVSYADILGVAGAQNQAEPMPSTYIMDRDFTGSLSEEDLAELAQLDGLLNG